MHSEAPNPHGTIRGNRRKSNATREPGREYAQQRRRQRQARGRDRGLNRTEVEIACASPTGTEANSVSGEAGSTELASPLSSSSSSKSEENAGQAAWPHFDNRPICRARLPGSRASIEHPRSTVAVRVASTAVSARPHGHASMTARPRAIAWTAPPERPTFGSLCRTRFKIGLYSYTYYALLPKKCTGFFAFAAFRPRFRKELAGQAFRLVQGVGTFDL